MPYTDLPASVPGDAVRLKIGDTSLTTALVSDNSIAYFLTEAGNDIIGAAILAARALQAYYSNEANFENSKLKVWASQRALAFAKLVDDLKADQAATGGSLFIGGTSIADRDALDADTDAPPTAFGVGQDDISDADTWNDDD